MLGHDWIEGGPGEDAVVADMGHIDDNLLGTTADGLADPATLNRLIQPNQPFIAETIDRRGALKREVKLFAFTGAGAGIGNDTVQGNDGGDWIHTGPGDDLANGNAGEDRIFGDDNTDATPLANNQAKVDALWGGEGHGHVWGGYGADFIDVRPRTTALAPGLAQDDPPTWFQLAGAGDPRLRRPRLHLRRLGSGRDAGRLRRQRAGAGRPPHGLVRFVQRLLRVPEHIRRLDLDAGDRTGIAHVPERHVARRRRVQHGHVRYVGLPRDGARLHGRRQEQHEPGPSGHAGPLHLRPDPIDKAGDAVPGTSVPGTGFSGSP
jgi:Ca2+-binding RTX toxin-like protein